MEPLLDLLRSLDRQWPLLVRFAALQGVLAIAALIGLAVDARIIAGAPAWLKPLKFALSVGLYLITMAWVAQPLSATPLLTWMLRIIGVILTLEVAMIFLQAARGTLSHFNVATPLDTAIFRGMGIGIGVVWLLSAMVLVLHWSTPMADGAMALAVRLGLVITLAGSGMGTMMVSPTPAQRAAFMAGERPVIMGAHTVGAPDGGPGLPVVRWSRTHGDLRVPHFLGMHGVQLLPLLLLSLRWMRGDLGDGLERGVIIGAAALLSLLFAFVLAQALAGKPLLAAGSS